MGTDADDATADRAKAVLKVKFLRHLVKGVCARVNTYVASNDTLKKEITLRYLALFLQISKISEITSGRRSYYT